MNSLADWIDGYLDGNGGNQDEQGLIKVSMKIEGEKVTTDPPIPSSFTHVDGTVDDGYVIQDGDGNQFVWVPVDRNQKIKINVTSEEKIDNISLKDPYGDEIQLSGIDNLGTTYNNEEVTPTINGTYVLTVTSGEETQINVFPVHSLYAQDTFMDWKMGIDANTNIDEFISEQIKENEKKIDEQVKEIEEEANYEGFSSAKDFFNAMLKAQGRPTLEEMGFETVRDFIASEIPTTPSEILESLFDSFSKENLEKEDYTKSVNDNGGFYIARYEASNEDGKVASKALKSPWNNINYNDALSVATGMYSSDEFTSSLPTGAAWDRTLDWLVETGAVTSNEIEVDSKSWGNYYDDTFSNTEELINTGEFLQTEKNHIFDLAGNLGEWTTQFDPNGYPSHHGGDYDCWSSDFPASYRGRSRS